METTNAKRLPFPVIIAKFPGTCPHCRRSFQVGEQVAFRRDLHKSAPRVRHLLCEEIECRKNKIINLGFAALSHGGRDEEIVMARIAELKVLLAAALAERDALHAAQAA